jgi:predicted nucleic acid-binding protein
MSLRTLPGGEFPTAIGPTTPPLSLSDTTYAAFVVRPAVVDTNALRNDLLRACATGLRTAFLDAGSIGLRFLVPDHVVDEMKEHLPEWVGGTDLARVQSIFDQHYVPILRVVTVSPGPLFPEEAARLARLAEKDEDDVPTARLAMLLHAPVLTRDKPLLCAVHGEDADIEERAEWLRIALAGRALSESDREMWYTLLGLEGLAHAGIAGIEQLVGAIQKLPPAVQLSILVGVGGAVILGRQSIADFLRTAGKRFLDAVTPMVTAWGKERELAYAWIQASRPPLEVPLSATGVPTLPPAEPASLARGSLYALARARIGLTPAQLASLLRTSFTIPATDAQVYAVLRTQPAFHPLPDGRWQVGRPWPSAGIRLAGLASPQPVKTVPRLVAPGGVPTRPSH